MDAGSHRHARGHRQEQRDEVFREVLADPLNLTADRCYWAFPSEHNVDGGAGLSCDMESYSKIIGKYFSGGIVSAELAADMERDHTENVMNPNELFIQEDMR